MQFVYEPALEKYMLEKKKTNIIVEPVEVNNSDFDVTELHVYLANDKQAEFFKTKRNTKDIKRSWEKYYCRITGWNTRKPWCLG